MTDMRQPALSLDQYIAGVEEGNKVTLARAITLIESDLPKDRDLANELVNRILPRTGRSIRLGISGVPGVGKSTFIEAMGKHITSLNKKLAVLAVDPSSQKTGGSILGDKTRMEELAKNPRAFIRPSPAGSQLGGVANKTRESILLCEAAGYEVIMVETVGVGQSETSVRNMVDFFLLLMLAGAGDELQGIKKGIIEIADAIVINKADGDNLGRVKQAKADLQQALHFMELPQNGWQVPVLTCSALNREGIAEVWQMIEGYRLKVTSTDFFTENRSAQNRHWMQDSFGEMVKRGLLDTPTLRKKKEELEKKVLNQALTPVQAAQLLYDTVLNELKNSH